MDRSLNFSTCLERSKYAGKMLDDHDELSYDSSNILLDRNEPGETRTEAQNSSLKYFEEDDPTNTREETKRSHHQETLDLCQRLMFIKTLGEITIHAGNAVSAAHGHSTCIERIIYRGSTSKHGWMCVRNRARRFCQPPRLEYSQTQDKRIRILV